MAIPRLTMKEAFLVGDGLISFFLHKNSIKI